MIKVLQINAGSENYGGVSSFLFTLFSYLDHNKVSFDFLSPNITTYTSVSKQIMDMGGNIIQLKAKGNFFVKNFKLYTRLKRYLKENRYVTCKSGELCV